MPEWTFNQSASPLIVKGEIPHGGSGTVTGPDVRIYDVAPVGRNGRYTMTDLAADHTLFSAAVLSALGLAAAPVAIYWAEAGLPASEAPVMIESPRPVLKSLRPPFDRILYACPNEHADGLLRFLDRFSVRRPDGVWESVHQKVDIIDWATFLRPAVAPKIPPTQAVHLYGARCDDRWFHWVPPTNPLEGPVCLTFTREAATPPPPKRPRRRPFT
jgi:hypothetical protein